MIYKKESGEFRYRRNTFIEKGGAVKEIKVKGGKTKRPKPSNFTQKSHTLVKNRQKEYKKLDDLYTSSFLLQQSYQDDE